MCFVYPESCYTLGITNCLASKLSTEFICLDRFCCRWAPVINNYKYLTTLHCLDPLWLNRQECKMKRQLNIWLWMTKASVCTVVWAKRQRSDYTAIVRLHSNAVHYSNGELQYESGATFTWSFIFLKVNLYVVQPLL